ncbi:MAG: hypothetical protein PVG99_12160 [Desulfobacteraceae bacterium]|jgi:hypothetical protein
MPMIDLKNNDGKVRWINVFPFSSLELARSYVKNSSVPLKIVKGAHPVYWVCSPEDAAWAVRCGYKEVQ